MVVKVDIDFPEKLKKYGAINLDECFNCGNCTAVCPLSEGRESFPRKIIRYSQLGLSSKLKSSKEIWLCYYCGECSDTCPRQAEPGELMAAARRYAIASYDVTGLSKVYYTSKLFSFLIVTAVAIILFFLFLHNAGSMNTQKLELFKFITFDSVHKIGIFVIIISFLVFIAGILRMIRALKGELKETKNGRIKRAFTEVIKELVLQERFGECKEEKEPFFLNRRILHWMIMWGFIGLGLATALDYLFLEIAGKVPGKALPLWHPTRLLGTLAGLSLLYGTTVTLILRTIKKDKYFSHSLTSDWFLVLFLWLAAVTGFIVEISLYVHNPSKWMYIVFLVHIVVSMELVLLIPFTKFAHAVYRPIALIILKIKET